MTKIARKSSRAQTLLYCCLMTAMIAASAPHLNAADQSPQVSVNVSKATPRSVEALTQRAVLRDYKFAWSNLALAMESNNASTLNGLFIGNASASLNEAVSSQRKTGLTSRYLNQNHKVDAVFYAPEGDVIELHDIAEYDYEILDGGKTIHNEHVTVHYVVLMTPGADRWVIRQLQAVQQF